MSDEELEELKEFTIYLNDIDDLALGLEICSKKSNMVIQEFIDTIVQLQQENQSLRKENKILRENAEHNDKVVDKFNWENQKLKKQLEEYKRLCFVHLINKCNKLENQQKEFINYLTSYIELLSDDPDYVEEGQKEILEEVLLKYKEMVSNNVNIER